MATPNKQQLEDMGQQLFECLMNRIYNVSDFERLGETTNRERRAIDNWLARNEGVENEREYF